MKYPQLKLPCVISIALSLLVGTASVHAELSSGINFNSQNVINLSVMLGKTHLTESLDIEVLDDRTGVVSLMLASNAYRWGDPGVLTQKKVNEAALISNQSKWISRTGSALTISIPKKKSLRFINQRITTGDGYTELYKYAGTLPQTGLHQIDVSYSNDAPGSFIINIESGRTLYVHGSDLTSISKNGKRLFVMNDGLNPPFGFLVSSLSSDAHGIEIECASTGSNNAKIIPFFKGWHVDPYIGFDMVILSKTEENTCEAIPIRVSQQLGKWHVSVPNPQRFAQLTKFSCWQ
jgi:hypothetical protein